MRARDLVSPRVSVSADGDAVDAVRMLVAERLPALLVLDRQGQPFTVLTSDQVVRALVPGYVQQDPALASVLDEARADRLATVLSGWRVVDCLPYGSRFLPAVSPEATAAEIAEVMARTRCPLIAVIEADGGERRLHGGITAARLLERLVEVAQAP